MYDAYVEAKAAGVDLLKYFDVNEWKSFEDYCQRLEAFRRVPVRLLLSISQIDTDCSGYSAVCSLFLAFAPRYTQST